MKKIILFIFLNFLFFSLQIFCEFEGEEIFNIKGDYEFPIQSLKVIEGKKDILKDGEFVKIQSGQEVGWYISNIKEGKYYILLVVQTGSKLFGDEEITLKHPPFIFLNGKGVNFDRSGKLFPYKDIYFSVIQSKEPHLIKNGDEIRWNHEKHGILVGKLILKKEKIEDLPFFVKELSRRPFFTEADDFLRIKGEFKNISYLSKIGVFSFSLKNVKGKKETYRIDLKILDYQQRQLVDIKENIELPNRTTYERNIEFNLTDTDRYRAILICSDKENNKVEKQIEILVDNPYSFRKKIWLNNDWEYLPIPDDGTLKTRKINKSLIEGNKKWEKVDLPTTWKWPRDKSKHHICWYRKRFFVSNLFANKRYFLHFSRVSYECEIYINGEKAGYHYGPLGPFEIEITKYLKLNTENEILIGIRDNIAALLDEDLLLPNYEYVGRNYRGPNRVKSPVDHVADPGIGEVYFYSTGEYPIEDIFIKTSFRKKTITLEITLPKTDKNKLIIKNYVYHKGKKVLDFPVYNAKNNEKLIVITQKWGNPILWGPNEFPLLILKTELYDKKERELLDIVETRFGFREFWPEGKYLYWNGVKVKLAATPFLSTWGGDIGKRNRREFIRDEYMLVAKRLGAKMLRHINDPESTADIADEIGLVYAQRTALLTCGDIISPLTDYILDSNEFWNYVLEFNKEIIKGLKNHPSIVTWYVSNESGGQSFTRNYERFKKLYEELLKIDDTRIIEFGCDIDVRGTTKIFSTHYPVDGFALKELKTFLPNLVYWRPLNENFKLGMKIPDGQEKRVANVVEKSPMRYGEKPIVINESCWIVSTYPPDGLTRIVGEKVYVNTVGVFNAHQESNKWFIYGHRDVEASVITPWQWIHSDTLKYEIPEVDINVIQKYNKFYEGEEIIYDVNLHYDKFEKKHLEFVWELRNGKDVLIKKLRKKLYFDSCDLVREKIKIKIPELDKKEKFILKICLVDKGKILAEKQIDILGYPKQKLPFKIEYNIGVYDPLNNSYSKITNLISPVKKIDQITLDNIKKLDVLIIGEKQTNIPKEERDIISKWVKEGGKVLVLTQDKDLYLMPFSLKPSFTTSTSTTYRKSHPLFKIFDIDEFNYWYPEHKISDNFYLKPKGGNYLSIIETGGPEGLVYTGLIEFPCGNGLFLFNQLNILDHPDKNPVGILLLNGFIEYLVKYNQSLETAGLILGKSKHIIDKLSEIGIKFKEISKNLEELKNFKTVIVDGNYIPEEKDIEKLRKYIEGGGTLFINKVTPENCKYISKLLEDEIKVNLVGPQSFRGRAIKTKDDELIEGLTNYEFFWKKRTSDQAYEVSFHSPDYDLGPIADYEILSKKFNSFLFPSILLKVNYGKGKIILNNINWEEGLAPHSIRIISTIMTNLGIEIEPKAETKIEIPQNLTYIPVDISKFLNRAFKDEKEDDGVGGWSDQGPDCDLSSFPLDKDIFISEEVPFKIEKPLSCIVLSSKFRPQSKVPEKVEIPVNLKADVLFFLQSSAWTTKDHHASYIINYEDGSNYEIRLIGEVNLRDWAAFTSEEVEKPFLYETDTLTKVAWTGTSKKFPKVSLYKMAWVNPYPEKKINSITFISKNEGVPILVAITAGVKKEKLTLKDEDRKIVLEIVEQAKKLIKEKKIEEGEKLLKEIIEKYPAIPDGYLTLAYIYEDKKEWKKACEIYEKLIENVPEKKEGYYSRLGFCYEELKDYKKAYEMYKKSLEINFNQPEILNAIEKVKAKIK